MGCFQAKSKSQLSKAEEEKLQDAEQVPTEDPLTAKPTSNSCPPISLPLVLHTGITKLYYFDTLGRAESIRMLLHLTDTPFEDHRLSQSEWESLKPSVEFEKLPLLRIDGRELVEPMAILRYLAAMHCLLPPTPKETYWVSSFVDEIHNISEGFLQSSYSGDSEKLESLYYLAPKLLLALEKRLEVNPTQSGWVVSGAMTIADLVLFEFLWDWFLCQEKKSEHQDKVPKRLKQFAQFFITRNPKMEDYITDRPGRPF